MELSNLALHVIAQTKIKQNALLNNAVFTFKVNHVKVAFNESEHLWQSIVVLSRAPGMGNVCRCSSGGSRKRLQLFCVAAGRDDDGCGGNLRFRRSATHSGGGEGGDG